MTDDTPPFEDIVLGRVTGLGRPVTRTLGMSAIGGLLFAGLGISGFIFCPVVTPTEHDELRELVLTAVNRASAQYKSSSTTIPTSSEMPHEVWPTGSILISYGRQTEKPKNSVA